MDALSPRALGLHQQRIIEIELSNKHERVSRVRTLPWDAVQSLKRRKLIAQSLILETRSPKTTLRFTIDRGGAELLKKLSEIWSEKTRTSVPEPMALAADGWQWHCSLCLQAIDAGAKTCPHCAAEYRSPRKGVMLSLVFPGAGLWYAKRPWLALGDFLGEAFVFALGIVWALSGSLENLTLFAVLLVFTKAESAHLSEVFLRRKIPATPAEKSRVTAMLVGGSLLSVVGFAALAALFFTYASFAWR